MKNNILAFILVIAVAFLLGASLLVNIHNTVTVAMIPLATELKQIETTQSLILQKLNKGSSNEAVLGQLSSIENKLNVLQARNTAPSYIPAPPPQEDFNKIYSIDTGVSPVNGKRGTPVTIVEFSDFQCPFCARFWPPVREVLQAYPEQVQFVIKNFPLSFHPNARPAAKMALAAGEQGKYYEMVDLLLQNGGDVAEARVKEYAKELKLNYNKLMNDARSKDAQYEKIISDDMRLGQKVDVRGTPTFYINGRKTTARDFNTFKTEIDKILAQK